VATTLSDTIFAVCAIAIAVSQGFILRSTKRGMTYAGTHPDAARPDTPRRAALEWLYAIAPALALAALLAFSWLAMHPDSVRVRGVAPSATGTDR
jgi:hypothetical protein